MRVKQYMNNPKASIYFYHKGLIKYMGVMLKGKMEVLTDQETKDMIWRKGDTMFYKGGVTDPDYCVLRLSNIKSSLSNRYKITSQYGFFRICTQQGKTPRAPSNVRGILRRCVPINTKDVTFVTSFSM